MKKKINFYVFKFLRIKQNFLCKLLTNRNEKTRFNTKYNSIKFISIIHNIISELGVGKIIGILLSYFSEIGFRFGSGSGSYIIISIIIKHMT